MKHLLISLLIIFNFCFMATVFAAPTTTATTTGKTDAQIIDSYKGPLPPCALTVDPSKRCRNVNDLVQLIINFGKGIFTMIGVFSFAFFVYGGFTMITSFGNAEKVKKGRDTLVNAIIGIVIALGAYLLINLMLDMMGVKADFRVIK